MSGPRNGRPGGPSWRSAARIGFQLVCIALTAVLLLMPFSWIRLAIEALGLQSLLGFVFEQDSSKGGLVPVDKLAHFTWFGWLTVVTAWSAPKGLQALPGRATMVLGYSWLLEVLQAQTGVRDGSWGDAAFNTAGVVVALVLVVALARSSWSWLLGPQFGQELAGP